MRLRTRSDLVVLATMLTLGVGGCRGPGTDPESSLMTSRARWARLAPAAYTFTLFISCECLPEMSGPVRISVRDGVVESRLYVQSGTAVSAEYAESFPAIEGLFAKIEQAVRDGTRPLEVRYDAELGYPLRIVIGDPAVDAPVFTVSDFQRR